MTWERLPIGELLLKQPNRKVLQQGWSPKCLTHPAADGEWGVLKTTAIQPGEFVPSHNKELPTTLEPRPQIEVKAGDLLITCAGPRSRCGVPALVRATPERLMMSGKMYRLRPDNRVDPRFLELYLLSEEAQTRIDEMKTGISDSGLNLTHGRFVQLEVPVPPLEEQRRIVAILEDYLSHLDTADVLLDEASQQATALETSWFAREMLLLNYQDCAFGDLLEIGLANGKSVPTLAGGFPVLRLTALQEGRVNLDERKDGAWSIDEAKRYLVRRGDFLISRGNGSLQRVGLGGLVDSEAEPVAYPDTLIRARPRHELLLGEYLALVWNAPTVRSQIEAVARTTAGIYKVNQKDLGRIQIPLPGIDDQRRVVEGARALREGMSRALELNSSARARSNQLRRSLLAAAFSGKLTGSAEGMSEAHEMVGA